MNPPPSPPRVSVILPAYNAEEFITEAITSILGQTFSTFELIIVEDGSTDATLVRIRDFTDARIRLIEHAQNQGFAASLNDAIAAATGDYLARHDADDISHPDRFATQVAYLDTHPDTGVLGSWYGKMDAAGTFLVERRMPTSDAEIRETLTRGNPFCHGSVMLRRTCVRPLEAAGVYREMVGPTEDFDLWTRLVEHTQAANLDRVLYYWRTNYSSMMAGTRLQEARAVRAWIHRIVELRWQTGSDPLTDGEAEIIAERDRLRMRWASLKPPSLAYRRSRHALILAEDHLRNGDIKKAIRWNLRALTAHPFWWTPWRLLAGLLRKQAMPHSTPAR